MRIADNTQTYYIADGNKNIIALKDSSGADVSTYAYTPFGSLENPADGDENPFRFSSEYADDETGLVYYNYRYYSPQLGRWTKRDPIEEEGGVNLYLFTLNNPPNRIDINGQIPLDEIWDLGNIIYDICVGDKVALTTDLFALAIPYAPAGSSKIFKLVNHAKVDDVIRICPDTKVLKVTYEFSSLAQRKHILAKSAANSNWILRTKTGAAKFLPGMKETEIKSLIEKGVEKAKELGKITPEQIDGFIFDTGKVIGASNGKKATKIKIHINRDGKNLHALPWE